MYTVTHSKTLNRLHAGKAMNERAMQNDHLNILSGLAPDSLWEALRKAMTHADHKHKRGFIAKLLKAKYKPYAFQVFVKEYIGMDVPEKFCLMAEDWSEVQIMQRLINHYQNMVRNELQKARRPHRH